MPGGEEAERALQLADEAWSRFDTDAVVANVSAAIRGFTVAGDNKRAALACVRLGEVYANAMGNLTASRAWFGRARRLVADEPPCVEQGWIAVAAMGCDVNDPAALLADAELALDRARRFGDLDLETKALADGGLAHVQSGRIDQGMAQLDEAMALACGPAGVSVGARSACSFFTACYHAGDFARASQWAAILRKHGLIGASPGAPAFLSSHCDSVQATVLVELGRWGEAEAVLHKARADYSAVMPGSAWHPDLALADLRVRQGRFADAEELLLGKDQWMQALLPAARLHLARGDHELAIQSATRGLRVAGDDRLRAVELLVVIVGAELAAGRSDPAALAAADLSRRVHDLGVPALEGRAALARSGALVSAGDPAGAGALIREALDTVDPGALPWLHANLLVAHARALEAAGDAAEAALAADHARSAFGRLDVVVADADVALLDRLAGRPPRTGGAATAVLRPDDRGWSVVFDRGTARLSSSKGLRYLAELLREPGRERHVLDLVDRVDGLVDDGAVDRRRLGDAGDLLDGRARTAYRRRIEHLRADVEDAVAADRLDAAEALQAEIDQLVGELARAFGLGGRSRAAASVAERARLNVTRAIRTAIDRIADATPAGRGLDARIRTGLYCAYEPVDEDAVRWTVQW